MMLMPAIFPSVGATFGRLSFLGDGGSSPGRTRQWRMQCACGTEKLFRSDLVRTGRSQSCGCLQQDVARASRVDVKGQRFGRLVAFSDTGLTGSSGAIWRCRCDCGVEKNVTVKALRNGATISCGCAKVDQPGLMNREYLNKSIARTSAYRARSRAAGGSFTAAQIDALYLAQRGRCACCRVKLNGVFHRDHRVALANGGTNDIGNIELLCGPCNMRKNAKDEIAWANENGRLL